MRSYTEHPKKQNWRLEPIGLAYPSLARMLTGTGTGVAHHEAVGQIFGQVWNQMELFLRSEPRQLAGYLDLFLTLDSPYSVPVLSSALCLLITYLKNIDTCSGELISILQGREIASLVKSSRITTILSISDPVNNSKSITKLIPCSTCSIQGCSSGMLSY